MAYKCEIVCDICGDSAITVLNETWSKTKMTRFALFYKWKHTSKDGYVCPDCQGLTEAWRLNFKKYVYPKVGEVKCETHQKLSET